MANITENNALNVLIVGAGIGGLTAAVGLRREGHKVTLFERSELAQEVGAALHIAPNAHGLLRRFGIFPEAFGANPVHGITEYDHDGALRMDLDLRKGLAIWQHPWVLSHRVRLHDELKRKATHAEGSGTPAVLHKSSKVVDVNPDTGTVTLDNGTSFSGDLILGADGVSSITRSVVIGKDTKPFSSGKAAFRFLIPHEKIRANPETEHFVTREGYMTLWYGDDRRLVMYPCNDNTTMNFVAIHPSELSASKGKGWDRGTSKETLLSVYNGFGAAVKGLLEMLDASSLKVWTLLDMERIPRWFNGKVVLLGDAAHPFLPHQGQGAAIAIEDAASLSAVLRRGTSADDIPERLKLYQMIRDERAHKIQEFTRLAGADLSEESRAKFNIMEFTQYNYGHDEWHNTTHILNQHLQSQTPIIYRQPLSFGPLVSPRQDARGRRFDSKDTRFVAHSIRFKTSATYLRTLFPTPAFTFASPGTVAEASFQSIRLDGLGWLGGRGYNYFGLWIHGVEYAGEQEKIVGSFLPVLFENLAEPVSTGREEVGMPKIFCDIDVEEKGDVTSIECSWLGTKFATLVLEGLKDVPNGPAGVAPDKPGGGLFQPPKETGLLAYRYIPAVGRPGVADAEYAVFISKDGATTERVVEKTQHAATGRVEVRPGDWDSLPTLHHIAAGLAEVPIYEVLEAKREEGRGVEDLSHARRIG